MILHNYVVWTNKTTAIPISKVKVGDKIACLAEDKSIAYATVKSILPLYSTCSYHLISAGPTLVLAANSMILSDTGYIYPAKGELLSCGTDLHRVQGVKESLTRKQFYDIMLDVDLPVIFQDGYCIKVRVKR